MTEPGQPPAILLMGPTASGKTELAVEIVRRFPCEIISVDSAMVYRGMDVGTAKPGPDVLELAPHRLIDILDPAESYSAARFREDARREMAEIRRAGRVPLLVGGTMLYFRALEFGLAELPSADPDLRARIDERARREGWAVLHAELARVDPEAAARIHPNDPQRLQRALEVYELTGRPLSDWLHEEPSDQLGFRVERLALLPTDRARLAACIEARFITMLDRGFIDEVRGLRERGDLDPAMPSMRAVGYRQAWEHLDGRYGRDEMIERAIIATRQLAKRQLTWLRRYPGIHALDMENGPLEGALKLLDRF
ncbi:MAG: tRNA (adenosine(37)-N6)-dimethylallyltransferase MiaA, partial [Chromatiales bacterium]